MNFQHARLVALAFAAACSLTQAASAQDPIWPTRAWQYSTPEAQGMNSHVLAWSVDNGRLTGLDSLLITRHGRVVVDAYYTPFTAGLRHQLMSATKSFVSTLLGISAQQGKLENLDRPILEFFPDKAVDNLDDAKKAVTLQHVLDMATGLEWKWTGRTDETYVDLFKSKDRIGYVLGRPMVAAPGSKFDYNNGASYVLSGVINRVTGQNALEFARKELFAPLGITDVRWGRPDAEGIINGAEGLFLTPHDMAKLGYLYLRDGVWEDRRIIPSVWVARARDGSNATNLAILDASRYANQWWSLPEKGAFMALGAGGQMILIMPQLDVVAVTTSIKGGYSIGRIADEIAAAVRSDMPLPADAGGEAQLTAAILEAATERPTPVGVVPELAKSIAGKTWRFADNDLYVRTAKLNLVDGDPGLEFTTYSPMPGGRSEVIAEPIGLAGYFRIKSAAYGHMANKGNWITDRTFQLDRRFVGFATAQSWLFSFDDSKVSVQFKTTSGWTVELRGEPVFDEKAQASPK
jgi:CubicO group peptidase (beta-lactamase class C family)